jgi:hypothetical protein
VLAICALWFVEKPPNPKESDPASLEAGPLIRSLGATISNATN